MIISEEQVRLALEYLQTTSDGANGEAKPLPNVPTELIERVRAHMEYLPEMRVDRVEQAKRLLGSAPSADEVAGKMLGRLISDSLR